jgi:hypothetical protein
MNKIIIDNQSDLDDIQALVLVGRVINHGRISNHSKQYCYLTVFLIDGFNYQVGTFLNKKSDRFIIMKES